MPAPPDSLLAQFIVEGERSITALRGAAKNARSWAGWPRPKGWQVERYLIHQKNCGRCAKDADEQADRLERLVAETQALVRALLGGG